MRSCTVEANTFNCKNDEKSTELRLLDFPSVRPFKRCTRDQQVFTGMLRKARFEIREFLISMELSGGRGLEDRYRNPLARSVFLAAPMAGLRGHVKRDALSSSFL